MAKRFEARPMYKQNRTKVIPSYSINMKTWEVTSKRVIWWTTNRGRKNTMVGTK